MSKVRRKKAIINNIQKNSAHIDFRADSSIGPVVSGITRSVYIVPSERKVASGVHAYKKK